MALKTLQKMLAVDILDRTIGILGCGKWVPSWDEESVKILNDYMDGEGSLDRVSLSSAIAAAMYDEVGLLKEPDSKYHSLGYNDVEAVFKEIDYLWRCYTRHSMEVYNDKYARSVDSIKIPLGDIKMAIHRTIQSNELGAKDNNEQG